MKNFTEARGIYDSFNSNQPDAIREVAVPASGSKLLEGKACAGVRTLTERKVMQSICECSNDTFKIFGRGFETVAKCSACGNEKVVHEG